MTRPYTGGTGSWVPLDLAQCVAPLPAACGGTEDSSLWVGVLANAPANTRFVVQAANGLGLVSFDDNRGSYYTASAAGQTVAETTLLLITPPSGGTFGDSPTTTAELKSAGTALAGKVVTIQIGGSAAVGVTGADGRVALKIPLTSTPGVTQVTTSFGGDAGYEPSSDVVTPFTIARATASLAPVSPFVTTTSTKSAGAVTTLTASIGGKTQTLIHRTVTVSLTGPVVRTVSVITDYLGRVAVPLGLPSGTYNATVTFGGDETYTGATRSGPFVIAPFAGFFSPVDNLLILNVASPGSTIPVKFSLGGNRGLAIFATGYPKAVMVTCATGVATDTIEETTAANSGLTYDSTTNQYKYNWKTPKTYAGKCYQLDVRFVDGSTYSALFKFK